MLRAARQPIAGGTPFASLTPAPPTISFVPLVRNSYLAGPPPARGRGRGPSAASYRAAMTQMTMGGANTYKLEKMPEIVPEYENLMYFSEEECYVIYQMIDSRVPINSMRKAIKERLSVIYESTGIENYETKTCNSAHVRALKLAARDKKKVILRNYESGNSHTIRDRLVEPFGFTAEFIDVFAYDLEAGKNKIFKIPRIGIVDILDEGWSAECHNKKPGMDIFRMTGNYTGHIKWKMSTMAKNLLVEEFPMAEKAVKYSGGPWILDTDICNYAGACRFYVGLMHEIEVVESEQFLKYIKEYYDNNYLFIGK